MIRKLGGVVCAGLVLTAATMTRAETCATMGATELVAGVRYCADSVLPPQSGNNYGPANLFDGNSRTAWCEGVAGNGIGQRITLTIRDGVPFDGIYVWNGYQKDLTTFARNARPRTLRIRTDLGEAFAVRLPDGIGETRVPLPGMAERTRIEVVIADVYSGSAYDDTCISGLFVDFESGRDVQPWDGALAPPQPEVSPAMPQAPSRLLGMGQLPDIPGL